MADETNHLIGLLLGTEEDWPTAFETLLGRLGPIKDASGTTHRVDVERITMEPFDLRDKPRYDLVVDRLAYWYYLPREWLKKVALMDDVYLLNSPFTFQSMEKHAAYCAMLRLGLKVPQTVLVPHKNPPDNARFAYTAAKYNQPFDLDEIAEPDRLPAVHEALRRRPVGRRQPHPRQRRAAPRLRRVRPAAHAPAGGGRRLRRVRPLAVDRRRDDGHEVPARAPDARPLRRRARLPHARGRRRGAHDQPPHQRVLPLGVQLVRDARARHRGASDRLRQRVARRRGHQPALLLPVGDDGAAALVRVLRRDRPAAADGPRHPPLLRDRRPRGPLLRGEARRLPQAGRRVLRGRALPGLLRQPARRTSTRWSTTGSPRPTSTGCSSTPCAARTRRTSRSASSPTSAGLRRPMGARGPARACAFTEDRACARLPKTQPPVRGRRALLRRRRRPRLLQRGRLPGGIEDIAAAVRTLVDAAPDAIQLSPGQARHLQDLPGPASRRW